MAQKCQVLGGEISYSTAQDDETNLLHALTYCQQREKFLTYLHEQRHAIEAVVARRLGLSSKICRVCDVDQWLCGGFNVCIPVKVNWKHTQKRVLMRFPLPYKVGEHTCPGNSDENIPRLSTPDLKNMQLLGPRTRWRPD